MKIRILHVIQSLGRAGAEGQLVLNLSTMDRERFENYVCYYYPLEDHADTIRSLGVPLFGLGLQPGKRSWPRAVVHVKRLIQELDVHIVHTSNFEAEIIGGIAAKLSRRHAVATLTNVAYEPERMVDNPNINRAKLFFTTQVEGLVLRNCYQSFVAISQAVRDSIIRSHRLPPDRVKVVYRALPDDWFELGANGRQQALREELGLSGAYPVVLNVGRLVPQKGQRYLIEAIAAAAQTLPGIHLLIAGIGPLLQPLTELAERLGIRDRVQFLGKRADIHDLLETADVFAFPSLYEGFGNAVLEAAAAGKPCVVSDIGPMQEILEDGKTGLFVPSMDAKALASGIIELARDRQLAREMGERARKEAWTRFRIAESIKKLEAVYEEVLG